MLKLQAYEDYEFRDLTGAERGVRMNQGATLLTLMLSFPHSQAKDLANEIIAPEYKLREKSHKLS